MEADPTVRSAIQWCWSGKNMVPPETTFKVWLDAFRGYEPWRLFEAARNCVKFEKGFPEISHLQKHYSKLKSTARATIRETFSALDLTVEENQTLRKLLGGVEEPKERDRTAFEYVRSIGKTRRTGCDS